MEALLRKRNKSLSSANSSNLSGGAIAGITVGVVAAVAIAIAARETGVQFAFPTRTVQVIEENPETPSDPRT